MSGQTSFYLFLTEPSARFGYVPVESSAAKNEQANIARAVNAAREMGLNPWEIPGFANNISNICETLDHEISVTKHVHTMLSKFNSIPSGKGRPSDRLSSIIILAPRFHDRGKLCLDQDRLYKEGGLDDQDKAEIRKHAGYSYDLLRKKDIAFFNEALAQINQEFGWTYAPLASDDTSAIEEIALAARHHHEAFDGSGYPDHLKGNEIPLASRILAIADQFDAQMSKRCYKPEIATDTVYANISNLTNSGFDPVVVRHFLWKTAPLQVWVDFTMRHGATFDDIRHASTPTLWKTPKAPEGRHQPQRAEAAAAVPAVSHLQEPAPL